MMKTHRPGIVESFIVHHRIKLSRVDSQVAESIRAEIDGLPGVDEVRVDEKKKTLWIAYDASKHHVDEMLAIAERHGARPSNSWWRRMRLGWSRQIDQNVRDNAHVHPACCNKPPVGGHHSHT